VQLAEGIVGNLCCAALLFLVGRELFGIAEYALDMGEIIEGFNISYGGMALGFALGIALHAALFLHALLRVFFPAFSLHPALADQARELS
jgi:hypothetical protein